MSLAFFVGSTTVMYFLTSDPLLIIAPGTAGAISGFIMRMLVKS